MKQYAKISFLICFQLLMLYSNSVNAQTLDSLVQTIDNIGNFLLYRNHDTTYISNYGNEVAVKLITVNKYNYFKAIDRNHHTSLKYRPFRDLSVGAGVSYKIFALDIAFSLKLREQSEIENPKAFDFQGRLFSSKQYVSGTLQYYRGYGLSNVNGTNIDVAETSKNRGDIRVINFGLQYLYAFNYTKFSLKAPFVFNEKQLRSAGSIIAGAGFSIFIMDADSSIVPSDLEIFFTPNLYLQDLNILSLSVNVGYMFTFVFKKNIFLTLSMIPGLSFNSGDYYARTRENISLNFNLKLISMNAVGYNGRRFFGGMQFLIDSYYVGLDKKIKSEIGYGKLSFFVGYRFRSKK